MFPRPLWVSSGVAPAGWPGLKALRKARSASEVTLLSGPSAEPPDPAT